MKKLFLYLLIINFLFLPSFANKTKAVLYMSSYNPEVKDITKPYLEKERYFKKGQKIYFLINNPAGFKSKYIKYQIIKQDDNAHVGGFTRIKNTTVQTENKNSYSDYFVIWQKGKYFLQIFDITDLNHWVTIEGFIVADN